jgi:hypothetical protein
MRGKRFVARPRSRALAACAGLLLGALALSPGVAPAQPEPAENPAPDMHVSVAPLVSTHATSVPWGWTTVLVTITNSGTSPASGAVRAELKQFGDKRQFQSEAPYAVPAGATVSVRLPVKVVPYAQIEVRAIDKARGEIAKTGLSAVDPSVVLFDTSGSQLRGSINDLPVPVAFEEPSHGSRGSGTSPTLGVALPRIDPATGDPILPDRAALYESVDVVLFRSDTLVRLSGAELAALGGYVLAGGTLAIAVTRPEDVRHPTIAAFAGGEVALASVSSEALRPFSVPPITGGERGQAYGAAPGEELGKALSGFRGGNLRGSTYGNSAPYGLGEVHLLAFDPTHKPAVDDAWARAHMVDLARRAYDRRANVVFRPGAYEENDRLQAVRKQLDPNESSRWAIAASALLLLVYAVLAGPVNYSIAARRNKPLSALKVLPICAAIVFFVVVGIGMLAKGLNGRARHLSLVEAGAGMSKASVRRYRGFFASRANQLTVRTSDTSSVVATGIVSEPGEADDHLVVDREGARLENVSALPWQTLVMREDGVASIGEGISILKKEDGGITVKNRSGHNLRAAILWMPNGDPPRYFAKIADGDAVQAAAGREIGTEMRDRIWISAVGSKHTVGSMQVRALNAYGLAAITDDDAPGLGDAWRALEDAAMGDCAWLMDDVPVLLAQMDGGEGRSSDATLRLESDRLLVRVVGYGGTP